MIGQKRLATIRPRGQSCLPCRQHKLRCSRDVPCIKCIHHQREDACRKNPAPLINGLDTPTKKRIRLSGLSQINHGAFTPIESFQLCTHRPSKLASVCRERPVASSCIQASPHTLQDISSPKLFGEATTVANNSVADHFSDSGRPATDTAKVHLINTLPPRSQVDRLFFYFLEHIEWIYRALHVPSLRIQYEESWSKMPFGIDLDWMSLLFTMIATAGLIFPNALCEELDIDCEKLRDDAHGWFRASRHTLFVGGYDARPTFTCIQIFIISQPYYLLNNEVEALNSLSGQIVRNAQALALHKACSSENVLEREMRHRVWWELCHADTFQTMNLGRPPLIQSYMSQVPYPFPCNNIDITESSVAIRDIDALNELSLNLFNYKLFRVLNRLYTEDCSHTQSRDFVDEIDDELREIEEEYRWMFQSARFTMARQSALSSREEQQCWGLHLIQSCLCMQRLRIYRTFLHPREPKAWKKSLQAAESAFEMYRELRVRDIDAFRASPNFIGYHPFTVTLFVSLFLYIEKPQHPHADRIRADLDIALSDREYMANQPNCLPTEKEGFRILNIITAWEAEGRDASQLTSSRNAQRIYAVLGGESASSAYLNRSRHRSELVAEDPSNTTLTQPNLEDPDMPSKILQWEHWETLFNEFLGIVDQPV